MVNDYLHTLIVQGEENPDEEKYVLFSLVVPPHPLTTKILKIHMMKVSTSTIHNTTHFYIVCTQI